MEVVLSRLSGLEDEYQAVLARISDGSTQGDPKALRTVGKRLKELEPIVERYQAYQRATDDLATAKELFALADGDDRELLRAEIDEAEATLVRLEDELKVLLLPRDPNDDKNVIVEIRGAEGGEEANLWARDLCEMYVRYADRMGWKCEVIAADPSPMGGYNEVTLGMRGEGVWSRMKHEGGPHRVQRVPATESQGRIHTSAATVTVLPEAEEIDVEIDPNDLQIDVYRASSAGGQHVNTTDSAVRITHKPTGVVAAVQDERSQLQNRAKAMTVLRSRLLKLEQDRQQAELSVARKSQVGGGGRGEKIRTYNFKENRVTDHRIGLTLYKLDRVLQGELDDVVDALVADDRARQLSSDDDDE